VHWQCNSNIFSIEKGGDRVFQEKKTTSAYMLLVVRIARPVSY
jgi:hypothetical protein